MDLSSLTGLVHDRPSPAGSRGHDNITAPDLFVAEGVPTRLRVSARCTGDDVAPPPSSDTTWRGLKRADPPITILVESSDEARVLKIGGELDIASCALVTRHCTDGQARAVVVDLADLTFLDCGGYRALVAARATLRKQGRSLTLVGAVGEPRLLLDLIRQLELRGPSC